MNAQHSGELRNNAINIQNTSSRRISDVEAYTQAMKQSGYGFSEANMERIAASELKNNGSLRNGSIYEKRPVKSFEYKANTQRRGLL